MTDIRIIKDEFQKIARQNLRIARTGDETLKRVAREDLAAMIRELRQLEEETRK